MNKKQRTHLRSPAGIAVYPRLNSPDFRFNAAGEYKVQLQLPKSDPATVAFLAEIDAAFNTNYTAQCALEKKKSLKKGEPCYQDEKDDQDNLTGNVLVKAKLKATVTPQGKPPFEQSPKLFGPDAKPFTQIVGGGSKIKIAVTVNEWYTATLGAGISLWLDAVQVIDYVAPGNDASRYGFGAEANFEKEAEAAASEPDASAAEDGAAPSGVANGDF